MSYTRVNWQDAPSVSTPISAQNLNKMDAGIKQNADDIEVLQAHTYDTELNNTSTNAPQTKAVKEAIDDAIGEATVLIDPTLSNEGQAADAKATGDAVADVKSATKQHDTIIMGADNLLMFSLTWTAGAIGADGSISSLSGFHYSSLVPVSAGDTYILYYTAGATSNTIRIHGYNSSDAWVQQIKYFASGAAGDHVIMLQIPSGVSKLRISANVAHTFNSLTDGDYTVVNLSDQRIVYGVVSSDGTWDNVSVNNRSMLIPARNNFSVTVKAGSNNATVVSFLTSDRYIYDGYAAALVSGTTRTMVSKNAETTFIIPAGTKIICVQTMSANTDCTPAQIVLVDIRDALDDIRQTITDDEAVSDTIESKTLNALDRLDKSFNFIAYSQISASGHSMNTKEHFVWASQKTVFTCIKGDIRPTLDNKLIMCHDAGFKLDANGDIIPYASETYDREIIISETAQATLLELKHASTGEYVCDFETYIKVCKKYGKVAFITIRDENIPDILDYMFGIINKYSMIKHVVFNSFTPGTLQAIRGYSDSVALHYVIPSNNVLTTERIDFARNVGLCVVSAIDYGSGTDVSREPQEVIEYAQQYGVRLYDGTLSTGSQIDDILDRGFTGAQLLFVPDL